MAATSQKSAYSEFFLLVGQALRSARNHSRSRSLRDKWRMRGMFVMGVAFWLGVYSASLMVLMHVQVEIPDFWQPIHFKLMSMILLTFFSVLLFSNVVTSLSTYFLSDDLDLIFSLPVSIEAVYASKFVQTIILSSWMIVIFGLPVLIAFGVTWRAGMLYYFIIPIVFLPFLVIPAALGSALTMTLVRVFPARRTRELLAALSIIVIGALFLLFRLLQPEQLLYADSRIMLYEIVRGFQAADYLPSEWATRILMSALAGRDLPMSEIWLIELSAPALFIIVGWIALWIYIDGWNKTQEGRRARISRSMLFGKIVNSISKIFPLSMRAMVVKDVKTFFRDTTQWSQLFMLAAVTVVYIFNFRVLPLQTLPIDRYKLVNYISFVNLGLAAFVASAVAVRFVFPMVSLEGRAWWIIKSSPFDIGPYLWSKFFISFVPLLLLAEILLGVTNFILKVSPFMSILGAWSMFSMIMGIVGMGVGMGALHPRFDVENAAQISVSYGGVVYMVTAMGFIAVSVILLVTPTSAILYSQFRNEPVGDFLWWSLIASLVIITLGGIATALYYMRKGIRNLTNLEA